MLKTNEEASVMEQDLKEWDHVIDLQKQLKDGAGAALTSRNTRIEYANLLSEYIRYYTHKKRKAATKVLVITLSEETRTRKPYTYIAQAIPFKTLTNMDTERLMDNVAKVVEENGGRVTGRVSDGEHNSLRLMGKTRPRNILKVTLTGNEL